MQLSITEIQKTKKKEDVSNEIKYMTALTGPGSSITLTRWGQAGVFEPLAGFALKTFWTGAVKVLVDAVTLGLVLTRVGVTGVRGGPAGDL